VRQIFLIISILCASLDLTGKFLLARNWRASAVAGLTPNDWQLMLMARKHRSNCTIGERNKQ